MRLLKLTEEVGDVAEPFISMHRLNARKGICRTRDAGVSGIAALMNFASHSRWENLIFGPAALVLAVLCILVARSAPAVRQPDAGNAAGGAPSGAGSAAAGLGEEKAGQPSAR